MIEFDCFDCGAHVFAWGLVSAPSPEQRCATCQWLLDTVADPAEREELRRRLSKAEITDG